MADIQISSILDADGSIVTSPASPSVGQSYTIKVGALPAANTQAPAALGAGSPAVTGATGKFSDAGHRHATAVAAPVALTAGGTVVTGASGNFADASHKHATAIGSPTALTVSASSSDGSSGNYADASHRHAAPTSAPAALVVGGSAVTGASGNFSDANHVHALAAFGTGAGTFAEGNDSRLSDDRTASGLRSATTVVSVSGATAPTSGQVLTATGSTTATWQSVSGGGGSTVSVWEPRAQPASAHADDNEFLGSIADFTDWDHGAYLTNTLVTAEKCLQISGTGNGTARLGGMCKAVPSGGEFSIVAQVAHSTFTATHAATGLMVMQGTGATDDLRTVEIQNNSLTGDPTVVSATFAAYNGAASATASNPNCASWLRQRVNGTTVSSDWSPDGITWFMLSTVTIGFTPTHMGVWTSFATANAGVAYFYCFRVKSGAGSSAFDANRPGRLVTVGV